MSVRIRPRTQAVAHALATPYAPGSARPTFHARIAAVLDHWAAGPRRPHNLHALMYVAVVALIAVGLSWSMADRTTALRLIALALFAAHVVANKAIVAGLTWLHEGGMPEARRALDAYLGPGQLTCLEIALIWIGFAVFAPLLDLIAPGVALAG